MKYSVSCRLIVLCLYNTSFYWFLIKFVVSCCQDSRALYLVPLNNVKWTLVWHNIRMMWNEFCYLELERHRKPSTGKQLKRKRKYESVLNESFFDSSNMFFFSCVRVFIFRFFRTMGWLLSVFFIIGVII